MKKLKTKFTTAALAIVSLFIIGTGHAALSSLDKSYYAEINILGNPGFEAGKSNWTTSSTTLTATTTAANVLDGVASGSVLIASNGGYVRSKTVTLPKSLVGQACEARVLYKGGDALTTLEVYNANNTLLGSQVMTAHADAGFTSAFFVCPSSTDIAGDANKGKLYVQIRQTTAGTHTVLYADDFYLGRLSILGETTLPDIFSAKIDGTASPSTVSQENTDWINGNCTRNSTGNFTCNFQSGIFTNIPNCFIQGVTGTATYEVSTINTLSASAITFTRASDAGTLVNDISYLTCMKQGTDAKQAIQVYKSIPLISTNINNFSAKVSSAGVVSDENTDWINANASIANTSEYTLTWTASIFGVAPNCMVTPASYASGGNAIVVASIDSVTTSSARVTMKQGGTFAAAAFNILCSKAGTDWVMPIVQPVFIGQVTQPSTTGTLKIAIAKSEAVCSASPCTLTQSQGVTNVTRTALGRYSVNFQAGYFSANPFCAYNGLLSGVDVQTSSLAVPSTTAATFLTPTSTGADQDAGFDAICLGY